MTANGFRVDGWKPLDTDTPAVVQDPNGKQWWIFFPQETFRHNPDAEHKWGPYPTERKAAETLVGFRYQQRIEAIKSEFDKTLRKRDRSIMYLVFLNFVLTCSTLATLIKPWLE